ncbi:MG2 domain-containing protein, partial [Chryseobacterium sp. 2TAF14]|uniref:MG2 domain-containing protein n=1 Tax=Chryseobacterium sp. 2TAF14 TaxID=3233007 RepID=UPI003F914FBB
MQRYSKVLFLLLFLSCFSNAFSQKYYETQWKKIQSNYEKGAYKSNLPVVLEIQKQAMKENNALQLIRSLKAEFSIVNQTMDDEKNDSASKFFAKLQTTENNLKGDDLLFYKVLLSGFMLDYYNEHSWEINGRTNINSQDVSQIETWSKLDFKNYLTRNFKELDQQNQAMSKISLVKYKDVFSDIGDIDYFSTLQDWYALKKINFLSNKELFTKNELAENKVLVNTVFDELIAENSGNSKLYFMHQKLSENCNFNLCKDKLVQLQNLMKTNVEGDYKVLVAEEIIDELIRENKQKEALQLAGSVKNQYPKSSFIENIKNKENQILNPSLSFKYEEQTQSNLPIHIVAEYKNVKEFSINIYEVKDNFLAFMQYARNPYNDAYAKVKKTLVRKDVFQLNDPQDFQLHKTSVEMKALPSGIYVAEYEVSGSKPDSDYDHNFYFIVSDHKVIYHNKSESNQLSNELKLISSENGKPINNENLTFYEFVQNKTLNKIAGKTDEKGIFKLPATNNKDYYRAILIQQPKTNDFQLMQIYGNNNREIYNPNKQTRSKAQIFTDRAIYRPGQTVYFKVINTKIDKETEGVVSNLKQKITLRDANNQEVAVQNFTTNEFGSYHGSFILPKGKLNGNFTLITDENTAGYRNIKVEEYKRPKFEVTFDPVKDEYKYGQTIELKGNAMMFSGVPLSNTNVSYEIRKQNIRWRYFPGFPHDYGNENSILGEAKTNEKGEFTIKLDLKKDEKLEGIQIDNYQINASVTDINGETQTANTNLKVSSVSHYIKADEIKNTFAGENVKIKVETKNYNEQNLKKSYHVK